MRRQPIVIVSVFIIPPRLTYTGKTTYQNFGMFMTCMRHAENACRSPRYVVSATKSGWGPDLASINHTYLSVLLHWGTKRSERVPKSWSYTHRPLIIRKVFLDDGENLGLMKKMLLKSLASFLDDIRCCSLFNVTHSSFSLAGYTVSGCYVVTMLT